MVFVAFIVMFLSVCILASYVAIIRHNVTFVKGGGAGFEDSFEGISTGRKTNQPLY